MIDLSDPAYNTLSVLRRATWLDDDADIEYACREVVSYLEELRSM